MLGSAEQDLKSKKGSEATAYLPTFQKSLKKSMDDIAGSLQSPMARLAFSRNASGYYERSMRAAGEYVGNESEKANIASYQGVVSTAQSQAVRHFNDPGALAGDVKNIIDGSLVLAHAQGLEGDAANHLIQLHVGQVYQSVAAARIADGDTKGARALLDQATKTNVPGTDLPIMDRQSQLALLKEVDGKEAFEEAHKFAIQNQAFQQYEHQRTIAGNQAIDAITTQLGKDPFSIDIPSIWKMTAVPGEVRNRLAGIVSEWQKKIVEGGPETKGDGKGFAEAWLASTLPADDPNKIWNRDDVLKLAHEGLLTPQGATKLVRDMEQITPTQNAQISAVMAKIKNQMQPFGGQLPSEKQAYDNFVVHAREAISERGNNHKTLAQLLDENSSDYLGKDAKSFMQPFELDTGATASTPIKAVPLFARLGKIPAGKEGAADGFKELKAAIAANPKDKRLQDQLIDYGRERGWLKPAAAH